MAPRVREQGEKEKEGKKRVRGSWSEGRQRK